ncbi:response regulator [Thermosulfurimonas dismutans]|uniref:Response regulatory domain-containing protein n=1 Tax=Thermosulfurimonas dismutans TaxID=999894 RepID=A0A179D1R2_9BACT|nr:response regulator [Thermosulfurimonas dismutans]OAQ20005.1 hypothetical protein TDIS_1916 [Thermosulfurimonas dismutans]
MEAAKILLIEDEEFIKIALIEFLRLSFPEVKVYAAETLTEARKLWSQNQFDIIISDCILPDGLACDFLEEIDFKGPIIIITGIVDKDKLEKAAHLIKGPLYILRKPVSLEKLARILLPYITRETP